MASVPLRRGTNELRRCTNKPLQTYCFCAILAFTYAGVYELYLETPILNCEHIVENSRTPPSPLRMSLQYPSTFVTQLSYPTVRICEAQTNRAPLRLLLRHLRRPGVHTRLLRTRVLPARPSSTRRNHASLSSTRKNHSTCRRELRSTSVCVFLRTYGNFASAHLNTHPRNGDPPRRIVCKRSPCTRGEADDAAHRELRSTSVC